MLILARSEAQVDLTKIVTFCNAPESLEEAYAADLRVRGRTGSKARKSPDALSQPCPATFRVIAQQFRGSMSIPSQEASFRPVLLFARRAVMGENDQLDLFGSLPAAGSVYRLLRRAPCAGARRMRRDRLPPSAECLLRHELLELSRLVRDRLSAPGERSAARARGAAGLRAPSASPDGRDRPRLLRADPRARSCPLCGATPGGIPVLRQGAGGGHVGGASWRLERQPGFPGSAEVPRRGPRAFSSGLRGARWALHPAVSALLALPAAAFGGLRREAGALPRRAAAGLPLRRRAARPVAPDGELSPRPRLHRRRSRL